MKGFGAFLFITVIVLVPTAWAVWVSIHGESLTGKASNDSGPDGMLRFYLVAFGLPLVVVTVLLFVGANLGWL